MRRYLIILLVFLLLASWVAISCSPGLQTFNKYGISFKVSEELRLEEYAVNFENQTFRKGTANYEQGAVLSSEKNFMLQWITAIPKFTQEEVRYSILTTPDIFESASGIFQARVVGDLEHVKPEMMSVKIVILIFGRLARKPQKKGKRKE